MSYDLLDMPYGLAVVIKQLIESKGIGDVKRAKEALDTYIASKESKTLNGVSPIKKERKPRGPNKRKAPFVPSKAAKTVNGETDSDDFLDDADL